jgi:hypothetical protein
MVKTQLVPVFEFLSYRNPVSFRGEPFSPIFVQTAGQPTFSREVRGLRELPGCIKQKDIKSMPADLKNKGCLASAIDPPAFMEIFIKVKSETANKSASTCIKKSSSLQSTFYSGIIWYLKKSALGQP